MLLILVLLLALQLCSRSFGGSGTSLCKPLQLSALQAHSKLLLAPTIRQLSGHLQGRMRESPMGVGGRWQDVGASHVS
ncbi:hypothetical protein V8C34DRAFT_20471 [Trichoderma compactum]